MLYREKEIACTHIPAIGCLLVEYLSQTVANRTSTRRLIVET